MKRYLLFFFVLLFLFLPLITAFAQEPDAFTDRLLQEISKMEGEARAKVGTMAPRKDTVLGKLIVLDDDLQNISDVVDRILLELGILTEITPGSSPEINEQDYERTIWFMAIVQNTTDGLENRRFVLPEDVICEEIEAGGRAWGYFNPYGFRPGCSVATPKDFADVRRLITRHVSVMKETWGIELPDNFLPWNCPRQDWPPSYGKQLWGIILRYGLPTVPTNTPRPGRTSTPASTSTSTSTPTGTLTLQPTVTGTRVQTATPTTTPTGIPTQPPKATTETKLWTTIIIILVCIVAIALVEAERTGVVGNIAGYLLLIGAGVALCIVWRIWQLFLWLPF